MARPTKLEPAVVADLHARRRRGQTIETIAKGTGLAEGTIRKGLALPDPAPPVRPPHAAPAAPAEPPPDDVPEDAGVGDIDRWMRWVEDAARAAKQTGEMGQFASLMTRLVALADQRRKAAPPPKADPNEHPDMLVARERVRAALHKALDKIGKR